MSSLIIYCYSMVTLGMCFALTKQQYVQNSPCPNVFNYATDGNEIYGIVEVEKMPKDNSWFLDFTMSFAVVRYTREMERLDDTDNIRFKMHFPLTVVVPKITKIFYINRTICDGPPADSKQVKTFVKRYFYRLKNNENASNKETETSSEDLRNSQNDGYSGKHGNEGQELSIKRDAVHHNQALFFKQPKAIGCGIGMNKINPLVLDGEKTYRGDWPWLVALYKKEVHALSFLCGGSLISNRHAITAAHCVVEKSGKFMNATNFLLKVGVYNLDEWDDMNAKTLKVKQIHFPPEFNVNKFLNNDVAILVFNTVEISDYVIPVCLWEEDDDVSKIVGQRGTVVGWGISENWSIATPQPRKAVVPIVSTHTCRGDHPDFHAFTSNVTLCAGTKDGSGPCNGDSGSGLYLWRNSRWTLRGIVSTSLIDPNSFTCNLRHYIIYADCAKYVAWIKQIINSN